MMILLWNARCNLAWSFASVQEHSTENWGSEEHSKESFTSQQGLRQYICAKARDSAFIISIFSSPQCLLASLCVWKGHYGFYVRNFVKSTFLNSHAWRSL